MTSTTNFNFKFKHMDLLTIFRTPETKEGLILIKVGKTSAIEFRLSGEFGIDPLTYVYAIDATKVRLKEDTPVCAAMSKRLLLGVDFNTPEDGEDDEPNPFKGMPSKAAKKVKVQTKSIVKRKDPGFTAKECARAELETETEELGPPPAKSVIFHPHLQPDAADAGLLRQIEPLKKPALRKAPVKKAKK